jgi:photosystem II stability/assembly factor-like uncharacterized protein
MKLPTSKPKLVTTTQAASLPAWELAFSEGRDLFAIWGKGERELFSVGDAGTVRYSADAGLSWKRLDLDTTESLYAVWGYKDTVFVAGAAGSLFRSRDSGKTWLTIKGIPEQDLLGIWGSSEDNVYVVGKNSTLLHATDGATFSPVPPLSKETLYNVWGSDENNVYIVGAKGLILRSVDQGKSWQTVPSNSSVNLRSIWGRSDKELYLIGYKPSIRGMPPQTEILTSTDGATFTSQVFHGEGRAIFGDSDKVYAVGPYVSVFSADKGATWQPWIAPNQHEALRELWGLWVSSTGQAFISGQRGLLLQLTATSPSITMLAGTLPVAFYSVALTSTGDLLAAGWQGNLLRWRGATLELLRSNSNTSLQGVAKLQDKLFAIGDAGALLTSKDNGASWKLLPNLNAYTLRRLFATDSLYVLAEEGLFTSTNGERWSKLWSDAKKNARAATLAKQRWYLVGDGGLISSAENAKDWKTQRSGSTQDLFAAWAVSEREAFVAGAAGTILYTNDGGKTWQSQQSQVTQNLTAILGEAADIFVVGTKGVLLYTKNAGETWREAPSPAPRDLYAITADERFLYVVGDGILARYPRLALQ